METLYTEETLEVEEQFWELPSLNMVAGTVTFSQRVYGTFPLCPRKFQLVLLPVGPHIYPVN